MSTMPNPLTDSLARDLSEDLSSGRERLAELRRLPVSPRTEAVIEAYAALDWALTVALHAESRCALPWHGGEVERHCSGCARETYAAAADGVAQ